MRRVLREHLLFLLVISLGGDRGVIPLLLLCPRRSKPTHTCWRRPRERIAYTNISWYLSSHSWKRFLKGWCLLMFPWEVGARALTDTGFKMSNGLASSPLQQQHGTQARGKDCKLSCIALWGWLQVMKLHICLSNSWVGDLWKCNFQVCTWQWVDMWSSLLEHQIPKWPH